MKKEDIIRKLTSRKFWMALVEFVTMLMVYFGAESGTVESVAALILSGAGLIAMIISEGLVDKERVASQIVIDTGEEKPEE